MAAIGSTAFAALVWGGLVGVALVFAYEAYAIAGECGRPARS